MRIPYYKQSTVWTCGPACMRMVLASLGLRMTEKGLAMLLKTNKKVGTRVGAFPSLAKRFKLDYVAMGNASISDIRRLHKRGYRIIIRFYDCRPGSRASAPEDNHFSVVERINADWITLLDPYPGSGPERNFKPGYFRKLWGNEFQNDRSWLFAVKK